MPEKKLHIVSFNIPYPPNYGGIIDIFFKLQSLKSAGVKITLHCFDYGRGEQQELNAFCEQVFYYKRSTSLKNQFSQLPYIVSSRANKQLIHNLCKDDAPILFEGLHTTFYLNHTQLKNRFKVVRTHNIEHEYYDLLAKYEKRIYERWFYKLESKRLKKYQDILTHANLVASISRNDKFYFEQEYEPVFWLPPFHPNTELKVELGALNSFALFHGNLSVRENIQAAQYIISTFKNKELRIIIAGKNPTKELYKAITNLPNISIESNLNDIRMAELIETAQVHLLPTFQPTGIKLKLMAALFRGKHCVANNAMINGTGLENLCHNANTPEEFYTKVNELMGIPFEEQDTILRKEILSKHFDNKRNAKLLIDKIFNQ